MRSLRIVIAVVSSLCAGAAAAASSCAPDRALGVERIVEIDTATGPIYGAATKFSREESFLGDHEVVLTFDDGPAAGMTRSILSTLDQFCTKATFFEVGRMAVAYPSIVKEVVARGHTVGTHTWSHPMHLVRMKPDAARDEIERGFAAVSLAAGHPVSPMFRFPGLSDSSALLTYLQGRGIATFTVDVISNDSFIRSVDKLVANTLERVESRKGGIILFHDIKPQTAQALPIILTQLKARGYKVVHMRTKSAVVPDPALTAALTPMLAKVSANRPSASMLGAATADDGNAARAAESTPNVPVTTLAPPLRPVAQVIHHHTGEMHGNGPSSGVSVGVGGWSTSVQRPRHGTAVVN